MPRHATKPGAAHGAAPTRADFLAGRVTYPPNTWAEDCALYLRNNHVLLSVALVHPAHPVTRLPRAIMLVSSLSFAYFITAIAHSISGGGGLGRDVLSLLFLLIATAFQIVWCATAAPRANPARLDRARLPRRDVAAALLGTSPCAHGQCGQVCACFSMCALCWHATVSAIFGVLGSAIVSLSTDPRTAEEVWEGFLWSKARALPCAHGHVTKARPRGTHCLTARLSRAPQTLAFIFAVPVAMAMFGLKREWEALGQPVATVLV